jgi:hypothetical protein
MAFAVVALQLLVIYVPFMSSFFGVMPLSFIDLLIATGTGALILVAMELEKWFRK